MLKVNLLRLAFSNNAHASICFTVQKSTLIIVHGYDCSSYKYSGRKSQLQNLEGDFRGI